MKHQSSVLSRLFSVKIIASVFLVLTALMLPACEVGEQEGVYEEEIGEEEEGLGEEELGEDEGLSEEGGLGDNEGIGEEE